MIDTSEYRKERTTKKNQICELLNYIKHIRLSMQTHRLIYGIWENLLCIALKFGVVGRHHFLCCCCLWHFFKKAKGEKRVLNFNRIYMLEMTRGNVLLDAMEFECVLSTKKALTSKKFEDHIRRHHVVTQTITIDLCNRIRNIKKGHVIKGEFRFDACSWIIITLYLQSTTETLSSIVLYSVFSNKTYKFKQN